MTETETTPNPDAEEGFAYLGVVSRATDDDRFECSLALGDELLRTFNPQTALAYATELTRMVTWAEYDAAVFAQMQEAEIPLAVAAQIMRDLRAARGESDTAATHPLKFTPIVAARDKKPRITAVVGEVDWQWELDDARQHVTQIMEVTAGVGLDTLYLGYLRDKVRVPERKARAMVYLLREHMTSTTDTSQPPPVRPVPNGQ